MGPAKGGILGGLFGHKASPVMWGQGCADRGAAWLLFSKKKSDQTKLRDRVIKCNSNSPLSCLEPFTYNFSPCKQSFRNGSHLTVEAGGLWVLPRNQMFSGQLRRSPLKDTLEQEISDSG